jgi:hypothetical protein
MILVNSRDLTYLVSDGTFTKFAKKGQNSETITRETIRVKLDKDKIFLYKVDGSFEPLFSSTRVFPKDTLMVEGHRTFSRLQSA